MVYLNFDPNGKTNFINQVNDLISQNKLLPSAIKYGILDKVNEEDMLAQLGGGYKKNIKKQSKKETKKEIKKQSKKEIKKQSKKETKK
jgi:hypothetical protein